jgi:hypothetical protein
VFSSANCLSWATTACSAALLAACSPHAPAPPELPTALTDISTGALVVARAVRAGDSLLIVHAARDSRDITQSALPRDNSGLIGRNHEWGEMYAARFQLGTGGALRVALTSPLAAPQLRRESQLALSGVEAGLQGMDAAGRLQARVPVSVSMGREATPVDVASGAAFYLGDACLGILALEASPDRDAIADAKRRQIVRAKLTRSARWLTTQSATLFDADQRAPNRLLFDARAFIACGVLADDSSARAAADVFLAEFGRSVAPGRWFIEENGWDTSYQAVSLDIGMDVVALLPAGPARESLAEDLVRGGSWLASRVRADGRVDSGGNTRTCAGGESFFGAPKTLALPSVVIGLARVAVLGTESLNLGLLGASRRVSSWARANPDANSCFEGIS